MAEHVLIDAHVHLHHPGQALDDLHQAARNFALFDPRPEPAVIMLAERSGYDVYRQLSSRLQPTAEAEASWLNHAHKRLLIIAGRQIITMERLEILGLGTRTPIPDGLPAREVLARLGEADAIAVLPWGVGKWLGKRGECVNALIGESLPGRLFLGDNGGRPAWWTVPQFSGAVKVLAGSDPLPLAGASRQIGRYGTRISMTFTEDRPWAQLKQALRDPASTLLTYGNPTPSLRFISDQTRLRFSRQRMEFA